MISEPSKKTESQIFKTVWLGRHVAKRVRNHCIVKTFVSGGSYPPEIKQTHSIPSELMIGSICRYPFLVFHVHSNLLYFLTDFFIFLNSCSFFCHVSGRTQVCLTNMNFKKYLQYFRNLNLKLTLALPIVVSWKLRRKFSSPKIEEKERTSASQKQKPSDFQNHIMPTYIQMLLW